MSLHPIKTRRAFTLIELLVVLGLMLALAIVAVMFIPRMTENDAPRRAAASIQGWCAIARSQAKLSQQPSGLRLTSGPDGLVRTLQYVQTPDPFNGGTVSATGTTATLAGIDVTGGSTDSSLWSVQPGDYIEFQGGGPVHGITAVTPTTPTSATLTLASALPQPVASTPTYRIIRMTPRALAGEQALLLPANVVIDLTTCKTYNNPLPIKSLTDTSGNVVGYQLDLLFLPSGALQQIAGRMACLWCRADDTVANAGEPALVVIFSRSGQVAGYQINTSVNTVTTTAATVGSQVQVSVARAGGISIGDSMVLDPDGANPEWVMVTNLNGAAVTFGTLTYSHPAGVRLVSDPYSFARTSTTSGM